MPSALLALTLTVGRLCPGASIQIDAERTAFDDHASGTHFVQGSQHAALAPKRLVGQADDQPVRRRDRGGRTDLAGDRYFVPMRIEQARGGERAFSRTDDPVK